MSAYDLLAVKDPTAVDFFVKKAVKSAFRCGNTGIRSGLKNDS